MARPAARDESKESGEELYAPRYDDAPESPARLWLSETVVRKIPRRLDFSAAVSEEISAHTASQATSKPAADQPTGPKGDEAAATGEEPSTSTGGEKAAEKPKEDENAKAAAKEPPEPPVRRGTKRPPLVRSPHFLRPRPTKQPKK
ncbi:hypothetical protein M3Y99_01285200 [Aphelenchoides fujianensis]|nr:hypothetical protein M3Y99_01285200 [Aphelenchoides fujianensis]